jgi:hypothetical protein
MITDDPAELANSTLQTLQATLQNAQAKLTADQQTLSNSLQSPSMLQLLNTFNAIGGNGAQGKGGNFPWMDGSGTIWWGADSNSNYLNARSQIAGWNAQNAQYQNTVLADTTAVNNAQAALSAFLNTAAGQTISSGIANNISSQGTALANQTGTQLSAQEAQTALANAQAAQQSFWVIAGLIGVGVVAFIIIIMVVRRNHKVKAAA